MHGFPSRILSRVQSANARWVPFAVLVSVFLVVYWANQQLTFEIRRDELHFWPSSLNFAQEFPPSVDRFRSYNDLNTPFPFFVFGTLEYFTGAGIWLGRLVNFLLCFGICAWFFVERPNPPKSRAWRLGACLVGLLLCPYFWLVATHLYTEAFAIFFGLSGMIAYQRKRFALSAIAFVIAIASRQYLVAFPAALIIDGLVRKWRHPRSVGPHSVGWDSLVFPALSAFSLLGWFWFFGGPAPQIALQSQVVETERVRFLMPQNSGYFLACIGAYFCLPQLLLSRNTRNWVFGASGRAAFTAVGVLALWFWLFPPLRNPESYPFAQMGMIDNVFSRWLGSPGKVGALYFLAAIAVIYFRKGGLVFWLLAVHFVLLLKAHIAWDKYALPLLCFYWWNLVEQSPTDWSKPAEFARRF